MFSGIASCIWVLLMLVVVGYPLWRIVEKAGYPGYMSLLFYVPILNLVMLWYAAMNPWPIERGRGAIAVPPPPPPPIV